MSEEKVVIDITRVVLKGGHDTPPEKKKKKKKKDDEDAKIPQSERDVDGLTYLEE